MSCQCYPLELQETGALAQLAYETVLAYGSAFTDEMTPYDQLDEDSLVWLDAMIVAAVYGGDAQGCYESAHSYMSDTYSWDYEVPFFQLEPLHQAAFKVFHSVVAGALRVQGVR